MLTNTFGIDVSGLPGSAAFTSFQLSSAGSFAKLAGSLPAGFHGPLTSVAAQPALVVAEIERLGRRVLKEIPVGVDGELEIVVLDRAPDRIAVEVDEDRRRRAVEDRRRIGLHAVDVLRDDLALVEARQHAIERDHQRALRDDPA